jgi:hypothetical protein
MCSRKKLHSNFQIHRKNGTTEARGKAFAEGLVALGRGGREAQSGAYAARANGTKGADACNVC